MSPGVYDLSSAEALDFLEPDIRDGLLTKLGGGGVGSRRDCVRARGRGSRREVEGKKRVRTEYANGGETTRGGRDGARGRQEQSEVALTARWRGDGVLTVLSLLRESRGREREAVESRRDNRVKVASWQEGERWQAAPPNIGPRKTEGGWVQPPSKNTRLPRVTASSRAEHLSQRQQNHKRRTDQMQLFFPFHQGPPLRSSQSRCCYAHGLRAAWSASNTSTSI